MNIGGQVPTGGHRVGSQMGWAPNCAEKMTKRQKSIGDYVMEGRGKEGPIEKKKQSIRQVFSAGKGKSKGKS